ncbi:hypothetical protein [Picrophilus oshimae]|uniref:Ferritin-like diiron domain-containing protein n=2 Tax=Picrophilus torridus (strain ATCC 700027 / DSM 9790 / JCM 10055 / NBRC 100828 / KAW 2/3) TaxID=1122961 RepID=Q6L0F5_PICTO|nr:hypothetical protein PTO0962 [Picrophilus oshimae DSM 9789]
MQTLGVKTEEGLRELLTANAEDHMRLMLSAEFMERLGRPEEARELRDKAMVELGHAKAIFSTLVKYQGLDALINEMAKEETEQHVSEYSNVAMNAKSEGHDDIEAMLCKFADQEKGIAETLNRLGMQKMINEMAKEETEQHVSEYSNVAMNAKSEGHDDIEAMLCKFADQEKGIAETLNRLGMQKMINEMAKEETEQHVSEYSNVAMNAKSEGHDDIEAMLCKFADQEKGIAETLNKYRNN